MKIAPIFRTILAEDVPRGRQGQPAHKKGSEVVMSCVLDTKKLGRFGMVTPNPVFFYLNYAEQNINNAEALLGRINRSNKEWHMYGATDTAPADRFRNLNSSQLHEYLQKVIAIPIFLFTASEEVERILNRYQDKLYVLIAPQNQQDKHLQHRMIISLVRIAQRGNTCAQKELLKWVKYITDDWIIRYPHVRRWQGYTDEIDDKVIGCIRRYRYTGTFLGYLFKTLEYSSLAKPPLYSLDDTVLDGAKRRIEYIAADQNVTL